MPLVVPDPHPLTCSRRRDAVQSLKNGLESLTRSFPWVAGQVVHEPPNETHTGRMKIKPLGQTPSLIVKDLRQEYPSLTMTDLRQAEFPFRLLDEKTVAPVPSYSGSMTGSKPVLLLQANLISGGLLLTIAGQHQAMDYPGLGEILRLLSKACQGQAFTAEEIATANLPRYNLIPFLDDSYQAGPELYRRIIPPASSSADQDHHHASANSSPPSSWTNAIFEPASLAAIKRTAENDISSHKGFISTDDALTAFVWKAIVRSRLSRLQPGEAATLSRAVNIRHLFNIPPSHPGMVISCVFDTATPSTLASEPLGTTASRLRSELDHERTGMAALTRAAATMLNRSTDKSILDYMGTIRPHIDLMFSSFSKVGAYGLDFGMGLGGPEAVRLPLLPADPEGLVYALPKRPDGQVVLAMCLEDRDIEALKHDSQFLLHGRFI
ncbi:transferase family-domain-containing protein [Aspergillus stella-maris]|uniref:transferase family-domain-containing protein n=1 Tax=Aspergillus stella-maris TaxID=1810926 RepID=UPI003CCD9F49